MSLTLHGFYNRLKELCFASPYNHRPISTALCPQSTFCRIPLSITAAIFLLGLAPMRAASDQSNANNTVERKCTNPKPVVCIKSQPRPVLSSKARALQDVSFSDTRGNAFTVKTWLATHKKPVLLVFWAPWCGPCMDEMPSLAVMSKKLDSLLNVVPISLSPITNAQGCLQENLRTFELTLYHSADSKTIDPIVKSIPAFFLIGTNGEILMESCGKRNWESLEEQNALRAHLVQKPKKPLFKE